MSANLEEVVALAPGVTKTVQPWGYIVHGTKDALIAAGLFREEHFADGEERDRRGRIARSKYFVYQGRQTRTFPRGRYRFEAWVQYGDSELEALEARKALERTAQAIASLPDSAERFRAGAQSHFRELFAALLQPMLRAGHGGWRYSDLAIKQIEEAIAELHEQLGQGETVFSASARAQRIALLRAESTVSASQ